MTHEITGQNSGEIRSRTMARVVTVQDLDDPRRARANLVLPGWNSIQHVVLPLKRVPPEVRETLGDNTYFFAEVNLAAKRARELRLSGFEVASPPVPLP